MLSTRSGTSTFVVLAHRILCFDRFNWIHSTSARSSNAGLIFYRFWMREKKIKIEINRLGQHLSIFHLVLMCYSYGYLILIVKINADAPIKMEIVFVEKTKKINQRKIKFWRELKYIAHKSVINWELSHSVYVCLVDVRTFECYMIFFIEIRWMVWFSFHLAMVLLLFQKAYRDLISPVNPLYVKMCVFFFRVWIKWARRSCAYTLR